MTDIDECSQRGHVNTNGEFHCSCEEGYVLSNDRVSCDGMYMHSYDVTGQPIQTTLCCTLLVI